MASNHEPDPEIELLEIVCQLCGQPFTVTMADQLSDDPTLYCCDEHERRAENPDPEFDMRDYI